MCGLVLLLHEKLFRTAVGNAAPPLVFVLTAQENIMRRQSPDNHAINIGLFFDNCKCGLLCNAAYNYMPKSAYIMEL